jgi:hypothetical protein
MKYSETDMIRKPRDTRIDFWRGLCLIDMILVHFVYQGMPFGQPWYSILGEYTRFAAGGFIMISGMSIGAIFLPRILDPQKRSKTYARLYRRSGYILLVHYVATVCFLLIYPMLGGEPFQSIPQLLWDILCFRHGSDLLPFYVVMVALAPAMLALLRRGKWWILALVSLIGFIFGQYHPYFLALPIQTTFMILPWQLLFVFGVLCGAGLPHYDRLGDALKRRLAGASAVFFIVIFFAAYGGDWNLRLPLGMVYWKAPLSTGEVMKYLAWMLPLMLITDRLWRWIGQSAFIEFSARMGRRSLAMYVMHVFFVAFLIHYAHLMGWEGPRTLLLALLGILMLWGVARIMDLYKDLAQRPIPWPATLPSLAWWRTAFNVPATGLAAIALLATINTLQWRALNAADGPPLPNITASTPLNSDAELFDAFDWLNPNLPSLSAIDSTGESGRV